MSIYLPRTTLFPASWLLHALVIICLADFAPASPCGGTSFLCEQRSLLQKTLQTDRAASEASVLQEVKGKASTSITSRYWDRSKPAATVQVSAQAVPEDIVRRKMTANGLKLPDGGNYTMGNDTLTVPHEIDRVLPTNTTLQTQEEYDKESKPLPPVEASVTAPKGTPTVDKGSEVPPGSKRLFKDTIPVPIYRHPITEVVGSIVSQALSTDLLGDPLVPLDSGQSVRLAGNRASGAMLMVFLLISLVLGSALLFLLGRYAPMLPLGCLVFIASCIVAAYHHIQIDGGRRWLWPSLHTSIDMWTNLDPYNIYYVLLPALLFGQATKLRTQIFLRCFWQVFFLGCLGNILMSSLIAATAHFLLPYKWDWFSCMLFGNILALTDPTSVAGLLKTVGISPRLATLVSGESLMSSSTSMLLFGFFLKIILGASVKPLGVLAYFVNMTMTSVCIGILTGALLICLVGICLDAHYYLNAVVQTSMSVCCGYVTFFVAENAFSTSGTLATIVAGACVADKVWTRVLSEAGTHTVWEMLQFTVSTLLFALSGLMFGDILFANNSFISMRDFGGLIVLFVMTTLFRAAMVALLWLPMNKVGNRIYQHEAVAIACGGVRGALSLALVMIVYLEPRIERQTKACMMYQTCGIVLLSLFNSIIMNPLLQIIKLVEPKAQQNQMLNHIKQQVFEGMHRTFKDRGLFSDNLHFEGVSHEAMERILPTLARGSSSVFGPASSASDIPAEGVRSIEMRHTRIYREAFLEYVHNHYMRAVKEGAIPRKSRVARVLLHSTEEALNYTWDKLDDWDCIQRRTVGWTLTHQRIAGLCEKWPLRLLPGLRAFAQATQDSSIIYAALCFVQAHESARENLPRYFDVGNGIDGQVVAKVQRESQGQVQQVLGWLQEFRESSEEVLTLSRCKMLARKMLQWQIDQFEDLEKKGILSQNATQLLTQAVHAEVRRLNGSSVGSMAHG